MRKASLLLLLFISCSVDAGNIRFGHTIKSYDMMLGNRFQKGIQPVYGFELGFSHYVRTCTMRSPFIRGGLYFNSGLDYSDLGMRLYVCPMLHLRFTRKSEVFFTLVSGIAYAQAKPNQAMDGALSMNTSLLESGFNMQYYVMEYAHHAVQLSVNGLYRYPLNDAAFLQKGWSLELKAGIGLNKIRPRRIEPHRDSF